MSKDQHDDLVRFVAQEKHVQNKEAYKKGAIQFWNAGDDLDEKGTWLNWYTNKPMPYLPWAFPRPLGSI